MLLRKTDVVRPKGLTLSEGGMGARRGLFLNVATDPKLGGKLQLHRHSITNTGCV